MHGGHEAFEQRMCRIGGIDDKPYGPIEAGDQQEPIDKRDVIRDEQRPAGLGDMLLADDAEAIERIREQDEQQPKERVGHQPKGPRRCRRWSPGRGKENVARREAGIGE